MKIITGIGQLREALSVARRFGDTIGFIPIMGDLHEGHFNILRTARSQNDLVIVSHSLGSSDDRAIDAQNIPAERYDKLKNIHVDYLFLPVEIYPKPNDTYVDVPCLHTVEKDAEQYRTVATLLTKLFNIISPTNAYFEGDDHFQIMIARQLTHDLAIPVEIVAVPIQQASDEEDLQRRAMFPTEQHTVTESSLGHLAVKLADVRKFGYRAIDIIVDRIASRNDRPFYSNQQSVTELNGALVSERPPTSATDPIQLLERLNQNLIDASANFLHSGAMGWVQSSPLPLSGILAGLLSSLGIFPCAWRITPGSIQLELTVSRWLGQMIGFDDAAFGYFTTGGTMANLYGLAAARGDIPDWDIRRHGVGKGPVLTVYTSEHAHICIEQSMALLGLGTEHLRRIPVDASGSMKCDDLKRAIEEDIQAGFKPLCIVGTAGTTLTGAIDPLDTLADIAARFGIWFHIDGSYGALAALDKSKQVYFRGIERASSIAVDPHKWLNIPFEAGCILIKDKKALFKVFACVPSYLQGANSENQHDLWHYGFELARADRATKVWLALSQYGVDAYAAMISEHNHFARRLYELMTEDEEFEPLHLPTLSALCFRYLPKEKTPTVIDDLNRRIEPAIREHGVFMITGAVLDDRPVLRVCFVNHRTTWADILSAIEQVRAIGRSLA